MSLNAWFGRQHLVGLVVVALAVIGAVLLHFSGNSLFNQALKTQVTAALSSCGYLSQANTLYQLQNDVTSNGTCFAIIAPNVTLDLNGHTITYDNSTPITVVNGDFENGSGTTPDNWIMTSAPSATRITGTYVAPATVYSGTHALKFSLPAADQSVTSTQTVTLAANTTYTLSAMMYNPETNHDNSANLYVKFQGTTTQANQTGITSRGFQYTSATLTTGASPVSYTIEAGVNGASGISSGNVYIDDIRVQRTKSMGVAVGPVDWRPTTFPDVNQYGSAPGAIIKNGTIVQGTGHGDNSHGIYIEENSDNVEASNLHITVYGENAKNIGAYTSNGLKVHDNTLTNNVSTITVRDHFDGAVIGAAGGCGAGSQIYNNTIIGGLQNGIQVCSSSLTNPHQIYNNTITLNTKYTNDFAINLYGDKGTLVHNNTINCGSGTNSCRGIFAGGNGDGTKIYANTITVQELRRNQEYSDNNDGCELGGAYGIQLEYGSNFEVYSNTVTANANECEAHAFRNNPLNDAGTAIGTNIYAHDNTLTATRVGATTKAVSGVKLTGFNNATSLRFINNTITTDEQWVNTEEGNAQVQFISNTWRIGSNPKTPFYPLYTFNWSGSTNLATQDFQFIDNRYGSPAAAVAFSAATWVKNATTGTVDPLSSYDNSWYLTVEAVDQNQTAITGAAVAITNAQGAKVYTRTTNSSGQTIATLKEFRNVGGTKTSYSPYHVTLTSNGQTATQDVTLDASKTIPLSLTLGPVNSNPTPTPTPTPTAAPSSGGGDNGGSGSSGGGGGGGGGGNEPAVVTTPKVTKRINFTAAVGVKSVTATIGSSKYTLYDDGKHNDGKKGDGSYGSNPITFTKNTAYTINTVYSDGRHVPTKGSISLTAPTPAAINKPITQQAETGVTLQNANRYSLTNFKDGTRHVVLLADSRVLATRSMTVPPGNYRLDVTAKNDKPGPVTVVLYLKNAAGKLSPWKRVLFIQNNNTYQTKTAGFLTAISHLTIVTRLESDLYRLKNVVEDSPAHHCQNVFSHTVEVLAGYERIRRHCTLPPAIHGFLNEYLATRFINPDGYTRETLLKMSILFHDLAKFDTLIRQAYGKNKGKTNCPLHELFSARYVAQYEKAFELDTLEADMIRHMVRDHGVAYQVISLIQAHGKPEIYLTALEPGLRVELLLLAYADMLGNDSPPEQKNPRIKVIVETLDWLRRSS